MEQTEPILFGHIIQGLFKALKKSLADWYKNLVRT